MKVNRILELDAIRGCAAILVVMFHYFYRYDEIYGHKNIDVDWVSLGDTGVQLFFMVSGFVIYWSLNRIDKPMDFIVSRFSRLYPVFWCSALLTFVIVYSFGLEGREVSFEHALINILMFHEYLKIPHIDGVYWTLTVELTFYFWMFSLYLSGCLKHLEKIFCFLLLVSVLNTWEVIHLHNAIVHIFILNYLAFFFAGICFFKLLSVETKRASFKLYIYLLLSLLSTYPAVEAITFLVYVSFFTLFYAAIMGKLPFLRFKPFIFLGTVSYSLYLLHQNIGYIIINTFYLKGYNVYLGIVFAVIISLFLAYLLTRFIEKPALIYIRNLYKNNALSTKVTT